MAPELPASNEYSKALAGWLVSWLTAGKTQAERDQLSNDIRRVERAIRDSGDVDPIMEDILAFGHVLEAQLAGLTPQSRHTGS